MSCLFFWTRSNKSANRLRAVGIHVQIEQLKGLQTGTHRACDRGIGDHM
jgi:hypothetical protein